MNTTHQEFPPQVVSSALFWPANPQLLAEVGLDSFSAQSFEYDALKTLTPSSDTFAWMTKEEKFLRILSKNIKFLMDLDTCKYKTANALAGKAGLNAGTVRNYIDWDKRTVTSTKPIGFPLMDKLIQLCGPLNCEIWELLHPDIAQYRRERDLYKQFRDISDTLPPKGQRPATGPQ